MGPSDQSGYSAAERSEIARGVKQVARNIHFLFYLFLNILKTFNFVG